MNTVTLYLEDWGDDDRCLMLLVMYAGKDILGHFDTFAEAKAFATKRGLTIDPS